MTKEELQSLTEEQLAAKYEEKFDKKPGNRNTETIIEELLGEENKPEPKKKSGKSKGSVDKDYEVPQGEENMVHFILQDHASPRDKNMNKEYKPRERVVKTTPDMFVRQFGAQFAANDAFKAVTTPGQVIRIASNLEKKHVEEAFEDQIFDATQGKPKLKAEYIKTLLERNRTLKLAGGNQYCAKVLHIPTENESYPFNPKDLNKFPEECLHSYEEK